MDIAKDAGFSISANDLKNTQSEVSDEELEGAAGVYKIWLDKGNRYHGDPSFYLAGVWVGC